MSFILMLTEEYVFFFEKFQLLDKLKNKDDRTMCQVFTANSTLWTLFEPNQIFLDFLIAQSQKGKATSFSRTTVCLFVSKLCWCKTQQNPAVPLKGLFKTPYFGVAKNPNIRR